jgi:hypothetical protein
MTAWGFASPREKRQGPASFPGASLMFAHKYSPRAWFVPLTRLHVSFSSPPLPDHIPHIAVAQA